MEKKLFVVLMTAMMAVTASAQEQTTVNVMLDFNQNPWGYPVREVTTGWQPDCKDVEGVGSILEATDFSWPLADGATEKVKVTVNPVDLDEFNKVAVYASTDIADSDAASLGVPAGKTNVLFTQPGTTMRFEAPEGYKFSKLVFYTYRSANHMVGDEYDEEFEYEYGGNTFKQKLKVWTPAAPKKNSYDFDVWTGTDTDILFNYAYFTAHFVKIDITLLSDGTTGIAEHKAQSVKPQSSYTLDGRQVNASEGLKKGIYVIDGQKRVVK